MDDVQEIQFKYKKKSQKKGGTVPLTQLGFKPKIYTNIQSSVLSRKRKYKAQKSDVQNRKQCFMARLTFFLDPTTISNDELSNFKGIKKSQWSKIKQIRYRCRDQLYCSICLEKEFVAPQITNCGHVFCWTCIFMHHYKSLKANSCPVCNQFFDIDSLITCQTCYQKSGKEKLSKIRLSLRVRKNNDKKVYDPQTLEEEINFARIVKITKQGIQNIFEKQRNEIHNHLTKTDDDQLKNWLVKVLSMSDQKIQKITENTMQAYKIQKNQKLADGIILSILNQKINEINFYQESNGKFIFLHPICDEYLRLYFEKGQLPCFIEEDILFLQQTEYNAQVSRKNKQLNHLPMNQQIDFVAINMKNILSQDLHIKFEKEIEKYHRKKEQQLKIQDLEAEKLKIKYQRQQSYLKQLKKMEQSQFYDIKVPTTINLSEINDVAYFPSLIQNSIIENKTQKQKHQQKCSEMKQEIKKKDNIKKTKPIDEQFPQLFKFPLEKNYCEQKSAQQVKMESLNKKLSLNQKISEFDEFPNLITLKKKKISQQSPKLYQKKTKKRKQKFIDVTEQFFQKGVDQLEDY